MITVAIVSPSRSLEPISKVIEEHDFGCEFHKYIYNELSDIDWIYADCKDKGYSLQGHLEMNPRMTD